MTLKTESKTFSRGNTIVFFVMRRMRVPLLVLLFVYTVTTVGMTLVPGVDDQGRPWRMDFFHAFYFISYTASTIGFGEIPYAFSDAQRLWVTFSIYLTVIAWFYAIGALVTLVQEEALRRALTERRFAKTVNNIHEPFYLICGYGDTGRTLVGALEERFLRSVVVEIKQERIHSLIMENYPIYVPKLCADASKPDYLVDGGLKNPHCAGVVALTNDSLANLQIAITVKLIRPKLRVIGRVDTQEVAANMASFDTDYIIDPFDLFAIKLHTALHSPYLFLLRECLTRRSNIITCEPLKPPRQGIWILCGYGRFGKAVYQHFKEEKSIHVVVIEATPEVTGYPQGEHVTGWGTEADTLLRAHVKEAVGIVAGTNNDVNNLSIVMTARQLNPDLFVVIRQNFSDNQIIFDALRAHIVMQASRIMADHIRILLMTPLLADFMSLTKARGDQWAYHAIKCLKAMLINTTPHIWETSISPDNTPAICEALAADRIVSIECLMRDPRDRECWLSCMPLLLVRGEEKILLPESTESLAVGDSLLWCGTTLAADWMEWTFRDPFVLVYLATGEIVARSYLWRWLQRQFNTHKTLSGKPE